MLWSAVYATNGTIQTSDERKKKDIENSDLGLDFISSLRPVSYRWKAGPDSTLHYGLIAQETEKAVEKTKARDGQKVSPDDQIIISHDKKTDLYGLKYSELISPVIESIQQLYRGFRALVVRVETLEGKDTTRDREIASLKSENAQMKAQSVAKDAKIAALKSLVCQDHPKAEICVKKTMGETK